MTKTIYVFDVDDTLFKTASRIYYTLEDGTKGSVSTDEFVDFRQNVKGKVDWDFKDFTQYDRVISGVKGGTPLINNLKLVDEAVEKGYSIGILTARSNQRAVYDAMKTMLLHKVGDNKFEPLPSNLFKQKYCMGIGEGTKNDEYLFKKVSGSSEYRKAFALKKYFQELYGFDNIVFFDDDHKNIDAVKQLYDKQIKAVLV